MYHYILLFKVFSQTPKRWNNAAPEHMDAIRRILTDLTRKNEDKINRKDWSFFDNMVTELKTIFQEEFQTIEIRTLAEKIWNELKTKISGIIINDETGINEKLDQINKFSL
jgi:hypothetical protein